MRWSAPASLAILAFVLLASACGGGGGASKEDVCARVAGVRAEMNKLTGLDPSKATKADALAALETIGAKVDELVTTAKDGDVAAEAVAGVEGSFDMLVEALDGVPTDSSVADAAGVVGPKVGSFVEGVDTLATGVGC